MNILRKPSEFDIRIWFIVVSLVAIVAINAVLALVLNRYVAGRMVLREGEVAQEFLNSFIGAEALGGKLFETPGPSPALVSFSKHMRDLPGVVRANVYSLDGFIRYSTEPNLIGLKFDRNEELSESFGGTLVAKLENVSDGDKPEHLALNRFTGEELIEAYIPVSDGKGRIDAVVEFYKKPTAVKDIIGELTRIIWIAAAAGGLILFLALYGAIARGARIIEAQKRELGGMAALAAFGQMASAVAHSLRNPLANIQSAAEQLQLQHPEFAGGAVGDIQGEVERVNQHVRELLEYSRPDKMAGQKVDLAEVLRGALGKAVQGLKRRNINLAFNEGGAASHMVEIDPVMFSQAVNSIVSNAVEAMPDGGTISVSVAARPGAGRIAVGISDTGKGMAQHSGEPRGLGLSLSIAKQIVERFGGSLALNSEDGRGTTVTLELPKAR
jgi:two-component system, NtrC family, sensor histidine kinase HydH